MPHSECNDKQVFWLCIVLSLSFPSPLNSRGIEFFHYCSTRSQRNEMLLRPLVALCVTTHDGFICKTPFFSWSLSFSFSDLRDWRRTCINRTPLADDIISGRQIRADMWRWCQNSPLEEPWIHVFRKHCIYWISNILLWKQYCLCLLADRRSHRAYIRHRRESSFIMWLKGTTADRHVAQWEQWDSSEKYYWETLIDWSTSFF